MPTYIKTVTLASSGKFNPKKDDPKVNTILQLLQNKGAEISDIKVTLGPTWFLTGCVAIYLITYEAPNPID